ncbi:MAG: response regulator transcription factor [Dehalococcoidales bacterium]|nr:MAG: response regulator transcription factor [Dehalococcoidales bacterium]
MKVLVIDDDPDVAQVISLCFEMRWPQTNTISAVDGTEGLSMVESESPDVIILDVGLPEMNGFEVCREIRRFSDIPIIMLTVRDADTDVSRALETGADDYISKPFSHIELLSRVQAVLRRTQKLPLSNSEGFFSSGNLRIDFDSREVRVNGDVVKLTPTEYGLLYHLSRNAGRVLTYQALLSKVWSEDYEYETNLLKLHIHNLRHKLGDNPQNPVMIINERGVGYKLIVSE